MDDITGIGKLAESEVVKKAYDDLLADAAKETGKLTSETLQAFRLLTAPIQLLATAQERFERWLNRIRDAVPEDRQVEAAPEIAGPALLNLRFMSDDNELQELYLNLLILAVDSENRHKAHPGFIRVIEQLSPRDAQFLEIVSMRTPIETRMSTDTSMPAAIAVQKSGKPFDSWTPREIQSSLDLLRGLSVVNFESANIANFEGSPYKQVEVELTEFGMDFVGACLPPLGNPKDSSA